MEHKSITQMVKLTKGGQYQKANSWSVLTVTKNNILKDIALREKLPK